MSKTLIAAATLLVASGVVRVEPVLLAADDPRQVVAEAQRRSQSKSQRYEGLLQSFDGARKTSEKRWTAERLGASGNSKAVIRFTAPPEVKGVAVLVVNHPDRASDQWMWTPAIERDRRIAMQDRSTRFFGTDFSFEDLEERDVNQFDYKLLGDDVIDGAAAWKILSIPKRSKISQYTSSIVWIRKDTYAFARIESYVDDKAVKRLEYSSFQNIQGVWTARETKMIDLRRGSLTRLAVDKMEYNLPLDEERFTLEALRRQ